MSSQISRLRDVTKPRIPRSLLCLSLATAFLLMLVAPAYASLSPSTFERTMSPGDSASIDKTVGLTAVPPMVDVVFCFDLTGSMGEVLDGAKTRAVAIMNQLRAVSGASVNFGVMSHMDYPGTFSSFGYDQTYGGDTDYAYKLSQPVTASTADVSTAIDGLSLGWGSDEPEDYTRPFYESYADTNIAWRPGAKRVLVAFGDAMPHDNNLNEGVPLADQTVVAGDVWSTGGDPGRDETILTADDLDLQTVLNGMATNHVMLLEAHSSDSSYAGYWDYWTGITGGKRFDINSETLTADIVNAGIAGVTVPSVTGLTLKASSGYEAWLSSVVPASYTGPTGGDVHFTETLKVPAGTAPGNYHFTVSAVDASGVSYGEQSVTIHVPSTVVAPVLTVQVTRIYWANTAAYLRHELSVDLTCRNTGGDAIATTVHDVTALPPTVTVLTPSVSLGTIAAGTSKPFTLRYTVPTTLSKFNTTMKVSCQDTGGTNHDF